MWGWEDRRISEEEYSVKIYDGQTKFLHRLSLQFISRLPRRGKYGSGSFQSLQDNTVTSANQLWFKTSRRPNGSDKKVTFLECQFKGWGFSLYHSMREPKKGTFLSHTVHTLDSRDLKGVISLTYFPSLGPVQTMQRDRLEAHIKEFGCVNTIAMNDAVRLLSGTKEKERLVQMSRSEKCVLTWLFAELAVGRSFASKYSVPRKHSVSSRVAQ